MQAQTSDIGHQTSDILLRPFISICIPAYKRIDFLNRLLDSIEIQSFKNVEVIVTDDSPGNDVEELCKTYQAKSNLYYHRNPQQLGTPENWNEAIRKSKGEWIKLMHDDDWFNSANSLQAFADAANNNPGTSFFFSAYRNIYLDDKKEETINIDPFRFKLLLKNPASLFSKNIIGPPSVTLLRNDQKFFYDKALKWLVDIDFYMRHFENSRPFYIDQVLINVGLSSQQVTKESFRIKKVEVPESFYLLNKVGIDQLKNIYVYDAWWRLIRNLDIRNEADVKENGYENDIPLAVKKMINFQAKIPKSLVRTGILSKFFMLSSFVLFYNKIK